jgi:hypothetical protein
MANRKKSEVTSAALDAIWEEIASWLEGRRIPLFLGIPSLADDSAVVQWSNDDWAAFLKTAQNVGAHMIYAQRDIFEEEAERVGLGHRIADMSISIGSTCELSLGFWAENIYHEWGLTAQWWHDLVEETETEGTDMEDRYDDEESAEWETTETRLDRYGHEVRQTASDQAWSRVIAEDPRFQRARAKREKRQVVSEIVRSLGLPEAPSSLVREHALPSFYWELVHAAEQILDAEIKPRFEEEARMKIPEFYAELCDRDPEWSTAPLKIREPTARRLLAEHYPFTMEPVALRLARYDPNTP